MEGKRKTCETCGGTGMVERIVSSSVVEGFEMQEIEYDECPSCNGGWSDPRLKGTDKWLVLCNTCEKGACMYSPKTFCGDYKKKEEPKVVK